MIALRLWHIGKGTLPNSKSILQNSKRALPNGKTHHVEQVITVTVVENFELVAVE